MWWLLPAIAAGSVRASPSSSAGGWCRYALVLLAALELGVWVFLRRDGAFRALIPTDAPFWLDRGVMAATAVVAVAAAIGAAVAMFRAPRLSAGDRRTPVVDGQTTACDGTPVVRPAACEAHEERMAVALLP